MSTDAQHNTGKNNSLNGVVALWDTRIVFLLGTASMKEMIKRTADGDAMIPANVTYPPAMIGTAIEMTAVGLTSSAPVCGTFTIGSVLVTQENAEDFYFPDSPF